MSIKAASLSAPFWVQDNSVIRRILHRYIDCVEKPMALKLFVRPTTLPELYDFDGEQSPDQLWHLITEKLEAEYDIATINLNAKLGSAQQVYHQARMVFNAKQEGLVREWLDRPASKPYSQQWAEVLTENAASLPNPNALMQPIHYANLTAGQIVDGFVLIARTLETLSKEVLTNQSAAISLRSLSARCFGGDSKFLDKRRSLLENAFPAAASLISPRAIMMSVYIPTTLKAAIFVENFDSFRSTVNAVFRSKLADKIAVVYSAGYRSSANLIRQAGNSQFVTINHVTKDEYQTFENWWFSDSQSVPVLFWGDLDYEGMGILKALRARFHNAIAFKAAYRVCLSYQQRGVCHLAQQAGKTQQIDPGETGCDYADSVLLPAIRTHSLFTDQEVVVEDEILSAIEQTFTED